MIVGTAQFDQVESVDAIKIKHPWLPSTYKLKVAQVILPGLYLCHWDGSNDPTFEAIDEDDPRRYK